MEKELVRSGHLDIMVEAVTEFTSANILSEKHTTLTIKACISELKRAMDNPQDIQARIEELTALTFS